MKNKKLTLVFLIILFLFILTCSAKAVETVSFTDSVTGITYTDVPLPDVSYNYYLIDIDSNNFVDFFYSQNPIVICEDGRIHSDGLARKNIRLSNIYTGNWLNARVASGYYSYGVYFGDSPFGGEGSGPDARMLYANDNICYQDDGTIFFRPVGVLTNLAVTVAQTEPTTLLTTILSILPLILVVLVSYLGLRKGLRLLSTLFHQA